MTMLETLCHMMTAHLIQEYLVQNCMLAPDYLLILQGMHAGALQKLAAIEGNLEALGQAAGLLRCHPCAPACHVLQLTD